MFNHTQVCVIGAACRLPGASDEHEFAHVLNEGLFTVKDPQADRWDIEALHHANSRFPGYSYTFKAGYLAKPYDFDINAFGMSPREAVQVDPQQRILAEVVWEALEDARIAPSSVAGQEVGVYIGVSALDHANLFAGDPGAIESHFMTGNTLSIIANRISYLFDLKGPSFVVDTACSSSLVAVDHAVRDIQSGRIDTAIVGGVNMLLSPASFVGFSRASMLSPTGVCRPFSANGDGYVRAEGAVAFVLRRGDCVDRGVVRASIRSTAVNSDGRTSGIALPSVDGQIALLERAYRDAELSPEDIAFIEAHGTGTAVGDPVEATAIGNVLGRKRTEPLPIGSVKSNIGHLEPASGVAGMMKALIALEQRQLPATLHLDELHPLIRFDKLNLLPAAKPVELASDGRTLHCGVSSFGFGGTNAHVIMSSVPRTRLEPIPDESTTPSALVLSAACQDALRDMVKSYGNLLKQGVAPARLANAVARGRQRKRHRAVLPLGDGFSMANQLDAFAAGQAAPGVITGIAPAHTTKLAFVFSGNGSQWAGMGRQAYAASADFRQAFDEVDAAFCKLGFTPLAQELFAEDLAERLGGALLGQQSLFAIQVALARALEQRGMVPDMVVGHSAGEFAAAHIAGLIDLDTAAKVIVARANSQEPLRGEGTMAVLAADRATVSSLIEGLGIASLGIAADNSNASVTVSGTNEAIGTLLKAARKQRIAGRKLTIEYPYHSALLDRIEGDFRAAVGQPKGQAGSVTMISTVTGARLSDPASLDADYWWHNIRNEVQFRAAIGQCSDAGCGLFMEIGPRPILKPAVAAAAEEIGHHATVLSSLSESDSDSVADIVEDIAARLIAHGRDPQDNNHGAHWVDRSLRLPSYPWQRKTFRYQPTSAAINIASAEAARTRHPLIGTRLADGVPEWRNVIDADRLPFLADHVVGGEVVVPATALAEMALAVAHAIEPDQPVAIRDFDIVQAMVVPREGQREVSVRYAASTGGVEIYHRPRFGGDDWLLCARGQIVAAPVLDIPPKAGRVRVVDNTAGIYESAQACGLDYGQSFRLLDGIWSSDDTCMEGMLSAPLDVGPMSLPSRFVVHPASLDCAMHGLLDRLEIDEAVGQTVWMPIRFERLTVWNPGAVVRGVALRMHRDTSVSKIFDIWLTDANGSVVARLDRALLRPVNLDHGKQRSAFHYLAQVASAGALSGTGADSLDAAQIALEDQSEARLLLRAHMWAALRRELAGYGDQDGFVSASVIPVLRENTPAALRVRFMLADLRDAGLLTEADDGRFMIVPNADLDDPEGILLSFAQDFPEAVADLALSAHAAASLKALLAAEEITALRSAALDRHRERGLLSDPLRNAFEALWREEATALKTRPLHVAVRAGYGDMMLPRLLEAARIGTVRLTVMVAGATENEAVHRRIPEIGNVRCVDLENDPLPADVDLAIVLNDERSEMVEIAAISGLLRAGGTLAIGEVLPDALAAFQTGHAPVDHVTGMDRLEAFRSTFSTASLRELSLQRNVSGESALLISTRERRVIERSRFASVTALTGGEALAGALRPLVTSDAPDAPEDLAEIVTIGGSAETAEEIAEVVLALRRVLVEARAAGARHPLWIACADAFGVLRDALAAFARVAKNEFAERALHWIVCDSSLSNLAAAKALAAQFDRPGDESFVTLDQNGAHIIRLRDGLPQPGTVEDAGGSLVLEFPRPGILEYFAWKQSPREAPGDDEVQIEVMGSALNFRDVMMAMGLLNDDIVDEGMTGPVLGFECVGRVTAVGENAKRHRVGDMVVGFGRRSFSTHVCIHEEFFFPLPKGLPVEASAAIPVAFFTAWYALVECARMRAGEKVLIHGGAGGVGLAAIQIAKVAGCEVITTVSTPDKHAVAQLYGADHVLNSRSLDFADEVQQRFGGVDIVLNSLSGEAMRASLRCLRPRGRFIELGKRDYVTNTAIGVRPFRRNLAYFGVDVDQVLAEDREIAAIGMAEILGGFEDGRYLPLPCSVFDATEVNHAFRTMQAAAHIGKIVVRPPSLQRPAGHVTQAFEPGDKVQLVVGGTRGFGLATALWLAERGARKIVIASRAGTVEDSAAAQIQALRESGCVFAVEAVDVTDANDVAGLIERVVAEHGPIGGVYHTAAVLDDGLIDDLGADALQRVLAPKIDGARNLDAATRGQPLDHFVLYSSVSALFGNPGQGAYCAANGYLEGLARRRRAAGLPALAVQWGAIADVGMLADRQGTIKNLERLSGVAAMQSSVALDRLGELLTIADQLPDPVVACADFVPDSAAASLPVLATPSFAGVLLKAQGANGETSQDLSELIAGKGDVDAQRLIADILAEEVAQILRLPVSDIDLDGSIDSLGMDSLMALELRMSIESRYRVELPVMAITSGTNIRVLAHRLLRTLRDTAGEESDISVAAAGLLAMHSNANAGSTEKNPTGLKSSQSQVRANPDVISWRNSFSYIGLV